MGRIVYILIYKTRFAAYVDEKPGTSIYIYHKSYKSYFQSKALAILTSPQNHRYMSIHANAFSINSVS